MSKFDEILNSSNPSDALLGEQIDRLDEETIKTGGWNVIRKTFTQTTANTLEYTGVSITVPEGKVALVIAVNQYQNAAPVKIEATCSATKTDAWRVIASGVLQCSFMLYPTSNTTTAYFWTSHATASANPLEVFYKFI